MVSSDNDATCSNQGVAKAVVRRCSSKKVVIKIRNILKKTLVLESHFKKNVNISKIAIKLLPAWNFVSYISSDIIWLGKNVKSFKLLTVDAMLAVPCVKSVQIRNYF